MRHRQPRTFDPDAHEIQPGQPKPPYACLRPESEGLPTMPSRDFWKTPPQDQSREQTEDQPRARPRHPFEVRMGIIFGKLHEEQSSEQPSETSEERLPPQDQSGERTQNRPGARPQHPFEEETGIIVGQLHEEQPSEEPSEQLSESFEEFLRAQFDVVGLPSGVGQLLCILERSGSSRSNVVTLPPCVGQPLPTRERGRSSQHDVEVAQKVTASRPPSTEGEHRNSRGGSDGDRTRAPASNSSSISASASASPPTSISSSIPVLTSASTSVSASPAEQPGVVTDFDFPALGQPIGEELDGEGNLEKISTA